MMPRGYPKNPRTIAERFWAMVDKRDDGHWLFTEAMQEGCGIFSYTPVSGERNKAVKAHRFSWTLANGPIPNEILVLHARHCIGTRNCVNPEHLYLGGHPENFEDRSAQGRCPNSPGKVVTRNVIEEIRLLHSQGIKGVKLAQMFDMATPTISRIVNGLSWSQVVNIHSVEAVIVESELNA